MRLQCSRPQIIASDASARQATKHSAAERQDLCIMVMLYESATPRANVLYSAKTMSRTRLN